MKNSRNALIVFPLVIFVIMGCSGIRNLLPKKGQFFDGDAAQTAATAIKDKIGKPFKVVEVFIDENEFRVQAQDPNKPKNIDEYKYVAVRHRADTGPAKRRTRTSEKLLPFDEIDFSAVPKFKEAIDKAGEGGKIPADISASWHYGQRSQALGTRIGQSRSRVRENVTASADLRAN